MISNSALILDGKAIAAALRAEINTDLRAFSARTGITPALAVILVGGDPASEVYVRNKIKAAAETGIRSVEIRLPATISQAELLEKIADCNRDPSLHGLLVQLPLPAHITANDILLAVAPEKDVDGFHPLNVGKLSAQIGANVPVPCTPQGCLHVLKAAADALKMSLNGAHAVVLGRSNIVGKPMAQLLLQANCTVTIAHSHTRDLPALLRSADVLVAAVGKPEMVKGDWIKPGAIVLDVGINRVTLPDGASRLVGDVEFQSAVKIAGAITPVPGGIGPMTITCLLRNTLMLAKAHELQ